MQGLRSLFAAALYLSLAAVPLLAGPTTTSVLGTVVTAKKPMWAKAPRHVGTTVYGGDRLSTEETGTRADSCAAQLACCS